MSFLGFGSEDKPKAPPPPVLDPRASEFQQTTYPIIERGLRGEGLFPELRGQSIRDMLAATTEEFHETQRDLPGVLARTIPKADFAVRDFVRKSIDASFARTKQGIREEDIGADFAEKNISQDLAFGALGTEKGIASSIANQFNESALRRADAPSFGSELASGLGGTAGILLAGRRNTTTQDPQIGGTSVFNPAGASYLTSQWLNPNNPAISYSRGFSAIP